MREKVISNGRAQITKAALADMFEYLDDLRDSGQINMFGAYPKLEFEFGLDRRTAREVWLMWSQTFSDDSPVDERVELVFANVDDAN